MEQTLDKYIQEASLGFKDIVGEALSDTANTDYLALATTLQSNRVTESYDFLSDMPQLKEWVGDRDLKTLKANGFKITKKPYEATISVDRDYFKDKNIGLLKPRMASLADAVKEHYNSAIFGLLNNNTTCYDGKAYFAADHKIGTKTYSNLGDKALSVDSFLEARALMRSYKVNEGASLNVVPSLLVVPPSLEATALNVVKAQTLANGESNIAYNMCEVLVNNNLTDSKAWYLFDTKKRIKPVILQIYAAPTFSNNVTEFKNRNVLFGVSVEHGVGFSLWQLGYKSAGTK